jgi:hypothetical protein
VEQITEVKKSSHRCAVCDDTTRAVAPAKRLAARKSSRRFLLRFECFVLENEELCLARGTVRRANRFLCAASGGEERIYEEINSDDRCGRSDHDERTGANYRHDDNRRRPGERYDRA